MGSRKGLSHATPAHERFAKQVTRGDHWLWTGQVRGEYPVFMVEGKKVSVHRWSYETFVGPIPPGMYVDHLCGIKRCVRPDHLEPVTARENNLRHYRTDTCRNGHPISDETAYWYRNKRRCRECLRAADRRRHTRTLPSG